MGEIVAERLLRRAPHVGWLLVLGCLVLPLGGCYSLQLASGQAAVMARSEPIDAVIDDPATPAGTRRALENAREARAFAVRELALPAQFLGLLAPVRQRVDLHLQRIEKQHRRQRGGKAEHHEPERSVDARDQQRQVGGRDERAPVDHGEQGQQPADDQDQDRTNAHDGLLDGPTAIVDHPGQRVIVGS